MDELVRILEKPTATEIHMLAGWQQWADAGSISSGLPQYLIDKLGAHKIAEIDADAFYLFQLPGTHHFLRPEIKLEEGYRVMLSRPKNEFYYAGNESKGLVIFLGEEPHLNVDRYAKAFFKVVKALGIKRIAAVGGVYAAMPYDKDREVSCIYSLPEMKAELTEYAVKFSNYAGGATIGSYLVDKAEQVNVPFLIFYAFVPTYDFSQLAERLEGIRIEQDIRAWYELMRRFNHMFNLGIDLSDLRDQSEELTASMDAQIDELARSKPQLKVKEYLAKLTEDFKEIPFMPLDEMWERELGDLFKNLEE